jgi:hypothetical protein
MSHQGRLGGNIDAINLILLCMSLATPVPCKSYSSNNRGKKGSVVLQTHSSGPCTPSSAVK